MLKIWLIVLGTICHLISGHKILFTDLFASTSHLIPQAALAQGLLDRGHEVTFLLAKKFSVVPSKAKQVIAPHIPDMVSSLGNSDEKSMLEKLQMMQNITENICEVASSNQFIANHLKTKRFDVIVATTFELCSLVTANYYQKDVPFMLFHPSTFTSATAQEVTGVNNWDAAFLPTPLMAGTEKMSFMERLQNMFIKLIIPVFLNYSKSPMNAILSKNLGQNHRDVYEISKDASFLLVNSNFEYEYPSAVTPDVVMTGCMQCRKGKPLPKVLSSFIDKYNKDGVIVFSLGSIVSASILGPELTRTFIEAFKELPQGIIWHSNMKIDNLPENILMQPWLPMQDVLADPRTKVVISHGGYLTMQEAIYHGVPYLGLPTMGESTDRSRNVRLAAYRGFGTYFDEKAEKTKTMILEKLRLLLQDPKYKNNARHYSNLLKDQILSPLELAIYKTEYLIRHKGAQHFKSYARNLSFIEYYMLDVLAVLTLISFAIILVIFFILKLLWRLIRKLCFAKKLKTH